MLKLYNVTEVDAGEYICKVSNYIGEANQSAWLTIQRATGNIDCKRVLDIKAEKNWCVGTLQAACRISPQPWYIHNLPLEMQLVLYQ